MIYGIGCDIVKVPRFLSWVSTERMLCRFFNEKELMRGSSASVQRQCEYYAVRFAAKESFAKALGTGLKGFELTDIYIEKNDDDKPFLRVTGKAKECLERCCGGNAAVQVSLSHEKEYAIAFVTIERG